MRSASSLRPYSQEDIGDAPWPREPLMLDDDDVHAPGRGIAFGVAVSLLLFWAPVTAAVLGVIAVVAR